MSGANIMQRILTNVVLSFVLVAASVRADEPVWQQWSGSAPPVRYAHAMAYDSARGVVVVFGGRYGSTARDDLWEWNGTELTERHPTGNKPDARYAAAMVYDSARGVCVLFGGLTEPPGFRGDTWEWDGESWTNPDSGGPSPRGEHSLAYESGAPPWKPTS